jgi:hypothetical protein
MCVRRANRGRVVFTLVLVTLLATTVPTLKIAKIDPAALCARNKQNLPSGADYNEPSHSLSVGSFPQ